MASRGTERVDFLVLGGGTAGMGAATRIARAGRKVVLVDPNPVGGLCALRGCNPKKVLVRASEVLQTVQRAPRHGVEPAEIDLHWDQALARMGGFVEPMPARSAAELAEAGVECVRARPRFLAPDAVAADGRTFAFEGVLIATGSTPRTLDLPGAEHLRTSDDVLGIARLPRTLAVIGGGPVAFEYGQMYARLGTRVHMVVRSRALKAFEPEVTERLLAYCEQALGMHFHWQRTPAAVERRGQGYRLELDVGETLEIDYVLNATGRVLAAEGLALEQADVTFSPKGVEVGKDLRSPRNQRLFAAGDAHGVLQLTPVASYEAQLVATNFLAGDRREADYSAVPMAVYTGPPAARVGLTEAEAQDRAIAYEVVRTDMSDWTVIAIADEGPAYAKVLYERGSGRVLGAHLYGSGVDNTIHLFAMAMRYGITRERLAEMIFVYPSLGSVTASLL